MPVVLFLLRICCPIGALKTSFSTVDEWLMKAVLRGILSRLFYLGDESVALRGKFASANLMDCVFDVSL